MTRSIIMRDAAGRFTAIYSLPSARTLVIAATAGTAAYYGLKALYRTIQQERGADEQTEKTQGGAPTKTDDNPTARIESVG